MTHHSAIAVIGAGYGDEGKGVLVDALAARAGARPVVARFNGGAQAGHTVTLADGRRHVFHHLASGALAGAPTHLTRFFVHHPMLLRAERAKVAALGGNTGITADPRGLITTPWDMLVNQAVERARGTARHGSCGLGFGETIERNLGDPFRLTVADATRGDLREVCDAIRRDWVPRRLARLGVTALDPETEWMMADTVLRDTFLADCAEFAATVAIRSDASLGGGPVLFEGAQGLGLDQDMGAFPHVTRSNTGLANVVAVAREAGIDAIAAIYVTRAYVTRHGAGPLARATAPLPGFAVIDRTNAPNPWQGHLRFAPLDLDELAARLAADLAHAGPEGIAIERAIAVTCLDQAMGPIAHFDGGVARHLPAGVFAAKIAARLGLRLGAEGRGPARGDIVLQPARARAA